MSNFTWYNAFDYHPIKRKIYSKTLIKYIEKYGVNTRDIDNKRIFDYLEHVFRMVRYSNNHHEIIDIILRYNPVIFDNNIICCTPVWFHIHDYYFIERLLENDVNYEYVRYRFYYGGSIHRNIVALINHEREYYAPLCKTLFGRNSVFMELFVNHCYKGITMFELMKYKLLR